MDTGDEAVMLPRAARTLVLAALAVAAGCVEKPVTLYDWDGYEASLYRMYLHREDFNPAEEAQRLSVELEQTISRNGRVPPGVQAHIGFLCAAAGDPAAAVAHFRAEKAAYPESAVFIDGMLTRMAK